MGHTIEVTRTGDTTFRVIVRDDVTTTHDVTLQPDYRERIAGKDTQPEELVRRSFEFLLERETNTSILPMFGLPVIGRYFPEYEDIMKKLFLQ